MQVRLQLLLRIVTFSKILFKKDFIFHDCLCKVKEDFLFGVYFALFNNHCQLLRQEMNFLFKIKQIFFQILLCLIQQSLSTFRIGDELSFFENKVEFFLSKIFYAQFNSFYQLSRQERNSISFVQFFTFCWFTEQFYHSKNKLFDSTCHCSHLGRWPHTLS